MNQEKWIPVPGFPIYEVSDQGRVRSIERMVPATHHGWSGFRKMKSRILNPILHRGYFLVNLVGPDKKISQMPVHQVVALAFHGPKPEGDYVVDHKNTNKKDNRPDNLEWVTNSENVKRQYRMGLLTNRAGGIGRWKHLKPKQLVHSD